MPDTAVIYARYSSDNQRDASIEQQEKECRKYAAQMGYEVIRVYEDYALTGKTDKRPKFLQMIKDSARQDFKYVIIYSIDRFSRNKYDSAIYKHKLKENGIRVLSAMEHITDDPTGQLMESILEGFAQYYSDELSQKINRGLTYNAENGIVNGAVPLGYRRGKDGHAIVIEEEAAVIREIFERVRSGDRMIRIAEELNRRGLKTRTGSEWNRSSFNRILSNERYIGVYQYKGIRIEGGFPAIIDRQLFDEVQVKIKTKDRARGSSMRRKASDETYLLTGKLYCGECGSPMSGISGKSNGVTPFYYYTCTKKKYEHGCKKQNVRRELVEKAVTYHLQRLLQDDDFMDWLADKTMEHLLSERDTAELDACKEKLKEATVAKSNIMKAIEAGIFTTTTKERLEELEEIEREMNGKIGLIERNLEISITKDDIISWLEMLRDGNVDDRNYQEMMIDAFLIRAYLYDDGHLKLMFRYTKEPGEITVPVDFDPGEEDGDSMVDSSTKRSNTPPYVTQANYQVAMIKGYFVCDVPLAI